MTYVPFDSSEQEAADWKVLRPGIPSSMRQTVVTWIFKSLASERYVYPSKLRDLSNALDIDFNLNSSYSGLINESESRKLLSPLPERNLLHILDYLLCQSTYGLDHKGLIKILQDGRSMYQVVERDNARRLATRVPEGVQTAAESIMSMKTPAGVLLQTAWTHVYELSPNDSAAYASAVKAVETASFGALGIADEGATLGHAIRAIEKKDARWRLPFLREHSQYPSKDLLLGTLKSLYRGQRDRHGADAYSDVTHEEAEGAVLLAVTLVGWFARGLVVEREIENFS